MNTNGLQLAAVLGGIGACYRYIFTNIAKILQ